MLHFALSKIYHRKVVRSGLLKESNQIRLRVGLKFSIFWPWSGPRNFEFSKFFPVRMVYFGPGADRVPTGPACAWSVGCPKFRDVEPLSVKRMKTVFQ